MLALWIAASQAFLSRTGPLNFGSDSWHVEDVSPTTRPADAMESSPMVPCGWGRAEAVEKKVMRARMKLFCIVDVFILGFGWSLGLETVSKFEKFEGFVVSIAS